MTNVTATDKRHSVFFNPLALPQNAFKCFQLSPGVIFCGHHLVLITKFKGLLSRPDPGKHNTGTFQDQNMEYLLIWQSLVIFSLTLYRPSTQECLGFSVSVVWYVQTNLKSRTTFKYTAHLSAWYTRKLSYFFSAQQLRNVFTLHTSR